MKRIVLWFHKLINSIVGGIRDKREDSYPYTHDTRKLKK